MPSSRRVPFLIPPERQREWSARQFVRKLPRVVRQFAEVRSGQAAAAVLQHHILTSPYQRKSFEAIGRELGITKQAAEASWKRLLGRLQRTMLQDNYFHCTIRFKPEFLEPLRRLSVALKGRSAFSQSDWDNLIAKVWHLKASELGAVETLILEIFSLRRFNFDSSAVSPIIASVGDKKTLEDAAVVIRQLLIKQRRGLTLKQITNDVRSDAGIRRVNEAMVAAILGSLRAVRKHGECFRILSRADQFYDILEKAGEPLHYTELGRRARQYGFRGDLSNRHSVGETLAADVRFMSVAQSGFWALKDWHHVETRTINEILLDELQHSQDPMHEDELFHAVAKYRSVKQRSIPRMLANNNRFQRVGPKLWSLAKVMT